MDTPSAVPPQIPVIQSPPIRLALGEHPDERQPIPNAIVAIEAVLRQPRRVLFQLRQPGAGGLLAGMFFVSLVCSLIYGAVVGSFSMGTQLWAAPVKLAGGLLVSAVICLPSLYIFACLSGSRARLSEICGHVAGLLLIMTLLLVGFAPVAWLFSQSTQSLTWMGALHIAFWLIATGFGIRFLHAGFAHSQARSSAGLNAWVLIFVLVALQMTTALRPLLGTSDSFFPKEKKFFLTHWSQTLTARPETAANNQ